jgi:Protein of unknown function (DUF1203)
MSTFVIHPLPAGEVDSHGFAARTKVADGPLPCRRCLRNAEVGEDLVLAPYDPFIVRSPYAGDGPVFVHADGCEPFEPAPGAVSEQVAGRVLSVRAYDGEAMMTASTVLAGERFPQQVEELLDDDDVAFLHVHFAGPGCFAFRVDRA